MAKQIQLNINLSNKLYYTFIALGVLIIFSVGAYAYNSGAGNPAVFGHSADELAAPVGCNVGQVLYLGDTGLSCKNVTDTGIVDGDLIDNLWFYTGITRYTNFDYTSCTAGVPTSSGPCTCRTDAATTSSTCTYNSFMSGGNNFYGCVYTCNNKPLGGQEKYSLKDIYAAIGSPAGSY